MDKHITKFVTLRWLWLVFMIVVGILGSVYVLLNGLWIAGFVTGGIVGYALAAIKWELS